MSNSEGTTQTPNADMTTNNSSTAPPATDTQNTTTRNESNNNSTTNNRNNNNRTDTTAATRNNGSIYADRNFCGNNPNIGAVLGLKTEKWTKRYLLTFSEKS